jgi:hypothetical protein
MNKPIVLTPKQREMVRHAVGFDGRHKSTFRNHYVVGASPDHDEWMKLVDAGLARRRPGTAISGGDDIFWATRDLALSVREQDENLSRDFRD